MVHTVRSKQLSVLAYANGFTHWHYKMEEQDDVIEEMIQDKKLQPYFLDVNSLGNILNPCDIIEVTCKTDRFSIYAKLFITEIAVGGVAYKIIEEAVEC